MGARLRQRLPAWGARDHPALAEEQPSAFPAYERRISLLLRRAPAERLMRTELSACDSLRVFRGITAVPPVTSGKYELVAVRPM